MGEWGVAWGAGLLQAQHRCCEISNGHMLALQAARSDGGMEDAVPELETIAGMSTLSRSPWFARFTRARWLSPLVVLALVLGSGARGDGA